MMLPTELLSLIMCPVQSLPVTTYLLIHTHLTQNTQMVSAACTHQCTLCSFPPDLTSALGFCLRITFIIYLFPDGQYFSAVLPVRFLRDSL